MARDRLAAIRAQQTAGDSNQQSYPQQSQRQDRYDQYESRGGDMGYGGGRGAEQQQYQSRQQQPVREDYRPDYYDDPRRQQQQQQYRAPPEPQQRSYSQERHQQQQRGPSPGRPGLPSGGPRPQRRNSNSRAQPPAPPPQSSVPSTPDFTTPQLNNDYRFASGPGHGAEPPRDFNPNQSQFEAGQQQYSNYATPPTQQGHQRSQYTPVDPVRTRQRSISRGTTGGAPSRPSREDERDYRTEQLPPPPPPSEPQRRPIYPEPGGRRPSGGKTGGRAPSYDDQMLYEDKGSTINLVDSRSGEGEYEMQRRGSRPDQKKKRGGPTIRKGEVPFEEMGEFFTEVSDLQEALRTANGSIQQIQALHMRILSLPSAEDPQSVALTRDLQQLTTSTRSFYGQLKVRIHTLEQGNANLRALIPAGQSICNLSMDDVQVRATQVSALIERFKSAIQSYAEVERDNRAKNRARMERQVKIVNPGLTNGEVMEVVRQAEEGGSNAVFSQALLTSSQQRSHAARGALREVESRAAELARIEQTLIELAQLFNDMAVLVEAQDVQIVAIEATAVQVTDDMEKGLNDTKKAVVSARSARKMRWWCFGVILVILIVVVIVVVVEVVIPLINKKNDNNAAPASSAAPAVSRTSAAALIAASQTSASVIAIASVTARLLV